MKDHGREEEGAWGGASSTPAFSARSSQRWEETWVAEAKCCGCCKCAYINSLIHHVRDRDREGDLQFESSLACPGSKQPYPGLGHSRRYS